MDRDGVLGWVARYEQAWRDGDVEALPRLFTEHAHYRMSPYEQPAVGLAAIGDFWLDDVGREFSMTAEAVAVEGATAVVRVQVSYGEPIPQEYLDLWLLRFAADGRVEDYEEWAYWPDKPYTAYTAAPPTG